MNNNSGFYFFLIIGLVFGLIAGAMAYLITYNEMAHHFKDKVKPRQLSGESALVAFAFFFLMTLAIGYVLVNYIKY